MSYDDTWEDDGDLYQSPSDDELIQQMIMQSQQGPFQVPGKTPANQQTFLSGMFNLLGYNPISLATGNAPGSKAQGEYIGRAEPELINPYRETYSGTPLYDTLFNEVENNGRPPDRSTVSAAYAKLMPNESPSDEEIEEVLGVVKGFAMTNIENEQENLKWRQDDEYDRAKFEQSNAVDSANDTFSRADGSKYKNAPLGGTDIYGTASEYDLLGGADIEANLDDVIGEYAKQKGFNPVPAVDQSFKDPTRYSSRAGAVSAYNKAIAPPGALELAQGRGAPPVPKVGRFSSNPEVDKYAEQGIRSAIQARLTGAKKTRVRSDANRNAMRVAAKYAEYLGRPNDK